MRQEMQVLHQEKARLQQEVEELQRDLEEDAARTERDLNSFHLLKSGRDRGPLPTANPSGPVYRSPAATRTTHSVESSLPATEGDPARTAASVAGLFISRPQLSPECAYRTNKGLGTLQRSVLQHAPSSLLVLFGP